MSTHRPSSPPLLAATASSTSPADSGGLDLPLRVLLGLPLGVPLQQDPRTDPRFGSQPRSGPLSAASVVLRQTLRLGLSPSGWW